MAVYKRDIVDINLETGNIHRSYLKHSIGMKDQKADHFGVRVFRDGVAVNLTGVSVQGVFMPPQGSPIAITSGNIVSGNTAEVVLPQACYNYDGQFCLAIKLVDSSNSVTGTVRIVDGMVDNTHASGTVAPTTAVPSYQEVLSTYEQAIAAINKTVRFDTAQSLTDTQKAQARVNIDAVSAATANELAMEIGAVVESADNASYIDLGNKWVHYRRGYYSTPAVGSTSSYQSSNDYVYAIAVCQPGDKVTAHAYGGATGTAAAWAFLDSSLNVLSKAGSNVNFEGSLTAPASTTFVLFNNKLSSLGSGYYAIIGDEMTQDKITDLKSAFEAEIVPASWEPTLKEGEYIKGADGTTGTGTKYARTNGLWYGYKSRIAIALASADYEFFISYYDSTGALDGTGYLGYSGYYKGFGYIPKNAELFGVTFRRCDQANLSDADITAISAALSAYAPTDTTLSLQGMAADAKTTGEKIAEINNDISEYNAFNIIRFCNGKQSRTSNGVTFTWTDGNTCTVDGEATANATSSIFNSSSSFPKGVQAGDILRYKADECTTGIALRIAYYTQQGGSDVNLVTVTTPGSSFTNVVIPENATGLYIRIQVASGTTITNGSIKLVILSNVRTARETYNNENKYQFALGSLLGSRELVSGDDLYTLGIGLYHSNGVTGIANSPVAGSFKLIIFYRNTTNTKSALLFASSGKAYTNTCNASGEWDEDWRDMTVEPSEFGFERSYKRYSIIPSGSDLFTLTPGGYLGNYPQSYENCPTKASFRLEIFQRNGANVYFALLFDSQDNIFITNKPGSNVWHTWKKLLNDASELPMDDSSLPAYYDDYMPDRIKAVNKLENEISANSDSFIFITDYHVTRNAGNSLRMIKYIVRETGITKLFFGGDAYATVASTETRTDEQAMAYARKYVPMVYSSLQESAPEFFSVFGNHEWNHLQASSNENLKNGFELNLAGVYNYCLKRHESFVSGMTADGNYYVDNTAKKIRYFFLQEDGEARPSNTTLNWLGDQLMLVPNDYYVAVICHFSYRSGTVNLTSYSGRMYYLPKLISDMLQAYNTKSTFSMNFSFTANSVTRTYSGSWNFASAPGNNVVAIFSGHIHKDAVLEKSADNILTIATTGDLYKNGSGEVMTFVDGEGNTIARDPETIYEQAFDVVHIDTENRKVYMTRFGGGLDREFDF